MSPGSTPSSTPSSVRSTGDSPDFPLIGIPAGDRDRRASSVASLRIGHASDLSPHSPIRASGSSSGDGHLHITPTSDDDDGDGELGIEPADAGDGEFGVEPADATDEPDAEIGIGDTDLDEETIAALERGQDIIVLHNHYIDPITGNVFTMNYAGQVNPDKIEDCTRALIGTVRDRMTDFLLHQAEHKEGFKEGLKDIKGYSFDWRTGTIELQMKGGTVHTIAAGSGLRDAVKSFLKDPKTLEKLPDPIKMTNSLQGISGEISPRSQALLLYLACNPHTESRLEAAIEAINREAQRRKKGTSIGDRLGQIADVFKAEEGEPTEAKRYRVLLETLRALKTGARTHLDKPAAELLEKTLQPAFSFSRMLSSPKVDQEGDPWLQAASSAFQTKLSSYAGSRLEVPVVTALLDKTEVKDLSEAIPKAFTSRVVPEHFEVNIKGPATALEGDQLAANPSRGALHLEQRINAGTPDKPKWVELTQVSCLVSKSGTKEGEAEYVHFARHGGKWWQMNGPECREVPWSMVQQLAAYHASKLAFESQVVPTASLTRERTVPLSPTPTSSSSLSPTPAQVEILTHGPIAALGLKPTTKWSEDVYTAECIDEITPDRGTAPEAYSHQEALQALREHQAKLFADDANRPQHLAKLYFPGFAPILAANPSYKADDNTFSPPGRIALEKYMLSLADNEHGHIPRHALCYYEMQEMANASHHPVVVVTGPNDEDRMVFLPEGTSLADDPKPLYPPVVFGACSLSKEDPTARASLTPLRFTDGTGLRSIVDLVVSAYSTPKSSYLQAPLDAAPRTRLSALGLTE